MSELKTEHKILNGVNVDGLVQIIEDIKDDSSIAKFNFRAENQWIEDSIAWIYWSDMAWIGGYAVQFVLGPIVYGWISLEAFLQFFEVMESGEWGAYAMGPYRRSVNGWILFTINVILTVIPGVNFVAPFTLLNKSNP